MKPVILALDAKTDFTGIIRTLVPILRDPQALERIAYLKFNDTLFMEDMTGVRLVKNIRALCLEYGFDPLPMLDFKCADTSGTVDNVLRHFTEAGIPISEAIVTVRENISAKTILELRRFSQIKIALVSLLTDIGEEECLRLYATTPDLKIIGDIERLEREYARIAPWDKPTQAFDLIVCSPRELPRLIERFPVQYQYITPGIRDAWMAAGQQARYIGIRRALNLGATYVVMGAQLTRGNPETGITPVESRQLTWEEARLATYTYLDAVEPIEMLYQAGGYYASPRDASGKVLGPLVGYAGKDEQGLNYVGDTYFNFAQIEKNPLALRAYGFLLARAIKGSLIRDEQLDDLVLLGMPLGGLALAEVTAGFLGCRYAFAEKKVTALANPKRGKKEESTLVITRHDLRPGDIAVPIEDVFNNFSTTDVACAVIESLGAFFGGMAGAINRSNKVSWGKKPVISVCHIPSPQYRQSDKAVRDLIKAGKIVWKPKHEWPILMAAMATGRQ